MQKLLSAILCSSLFFSINAFANKDDIVGQWRTIDDKTGFSKAIVEIKKDGNGTYTGKIIEIIPRPGYIPKTHCQKCPAPFTNQPILGLAVLNDMKQADKTGEWEGGTILDPLNGRIYKSRIKLNSSGTRLTM